jgi:glycosyltransferase involved in cell wall biosynthesis
MTDNMPKSVRVLFIVARMPVGGAETFLISLLNRLDKNLIQPFVFSLGSEGDPLYQKIPQDVFKYVRARKWRYDLSPCESIGSLIVSEKIQTVVCSDYFTYFYIWKILRKQKLNIRVIILLHVTKPRHLKEFLHGFIFARMLSGSEEILTTCENQRKFLSRIFMIPQKRFAEIIYNGVDTNYWTLPADSQRRLDLRKQFGIPENAIVIINVAGFRKEKRHDLMVKAFHELYLKSSREDIYLVFVGGGDRQIQDSAQQLARQYNLSGKIIFAGIQDDLRSMYWMADIFTLGSTSETFSIAALEAMSTGLPSVLTDIGGASEMIQTNINGVIVKPYSSQALASGWMKCIELLPSMDNSDIRNGVVDRFNLNNCIQYYNRYLSGSN